VILFLVWHDEDSLFPWALELSRGLWNQFGLEALTNPEYSKTTAYPIWDSAKDDDGNVATFEASIFLCDT
jgi:hypothetical protein